jgi:hypothetical protein
MIQSLYEEVVVRGASFVSVRLSPEAYAHGPRTRTSGGGCRACPSLSRPVTEDMALARPTGFNRADAVNLRIPIGEADIGLVAAGVIGVRAPPVARPAIVLKAAGRRLTASRRATLLPGRPASRVLSTA